MKKFYAERDGGRPYILNESQTDRVAEMIGADLKAWNDARLMAAAGDMAEALKVILSYDDMQEGSDLAKKALNKAGVRHE